LYFGTKPTIPFGKSPPLCAKAAHERHVEKRLCERQTIGLN